MTQRYQRLFTLEQNLYAEGAPVLIAAGALLWDTKMNRVLAQLKLRCLSTKGLRGVRLELQPRDLAERPLGKPVTYSYLDLTTAFGGEFGTKNPILMPDPTTRCFTVKVQEVVFGDRSVWQGEGAWKPLERQEPLENALGEELTREYRLLHGRESRFVPRHDRGLWQCSCGALYPDTLNNCPNCGRESRELDRAALEQSLETRLEAARQAVEEQKRREAETARLAAEERGRQEAEAARRAAEEQAWREAREEEQRVMIAARWQAQQEAEAARLEAEEAERVRIEEQWKARQLQQAREEEQQSANRQSAQQDDGEKAEQTPAQPAKTAEPKKKKKRLWVLPAVLLILAGLAAGGWFYGVPQFRYMQAEKLAAEEKNEEAAAAFEALGSFRDAEQRAAELREAIQDKTDAEPSGLNGDEETEKIALVPLDQCKAGDYVSFGAFEQDGSKDNGAEPIVWIVLRRKGDQVLLLSKDCLTSRAFQSGSGEVTWEKSSLRAWLNGEFYDTAFSGEEDLRPAIVSTVVTSPVGGSARSTHDKVFLLSYDQVSLYIIGKLDDAVLAGRATPAAGARELSWWLVAPLQSSSGATLVPIMPPAGDSYEYTDGDAACGVRPAIWVDVNKAG